MLYASSYQRERAVQAPFSELVGSLETLSVEDGELSLHRCIALHTSVDIACRRLGLKTLSQGSQCQARHHTDLNLHSPGLPRRKRSG